MALYHIISVFRHMTASARAARSGFAEDWLHAHNHLPAMSHNPRGHTLGVVGLGNIGFAIAVKVKAALGMKIVYHDVVRKTYDHDDHIDAKFYDKLDDMLPECDCLLIATPGGPPLLNKRTLSLLRQGSRVVNIARGSLVDETDLADALDSGHIDAAGLDVFTNEPRVNPRLAAMPNVEMTCHTGGGSVETNIGFERLSMENCEAVLKGMDPSTPVNIRWLKPKQPLNEVQTPDPAGQNHDKQSEVQPVEPPAIDPNLPAVNSDTPLTDTDPPLNNTDPPAIDTEVPPTNTDPPASGTITRPAVDTQLPPASTRTLNDDQAALPLSAQIDSAVSMSMDEGHGVPKFHDQLQSTPLPSASSV